ncbi:hypothetical protein GGR52DRAFT_548196 [Hypoxylon sp. FL1284]|nr:hypothetical protein GGR52DRAFT_548196 [Hypoxylon sp. FL1284]
MIHHKVRFSSIIFSTRMISTSLSLLRPSHGVSLHDFSRRRPILGIVRPATSHTSHALGTYVGTWYLTVERVSRVPRYL